MHPSQAELQTPMKQSSFANDFEIIIIGIANSSLSDLFEENDFIYQLFYLLVFEKVVNAINFCWYVWLEKLKVLESSGLNSWKAVMLFKKYRQHVDKK